LTPTGLEQNTRKECNASDIGFLPDSYWIPTGVSFKVYSKNQALSHLTTMAKSKDDAQSMQSTKSKTTGSSFVKKAKSGLATLKRKATEVLSPKKKKPRFPADEETLVCQLTPTDPK
jgi:hypothetical protein